MATEQPHEHDPDDHACRYIGLEMWVCGHTDFGECECACCIGECDGTEIVVPTPEDPERFLRAMGEMDTLEW